MTWRYELAYEPFCSHASAVADHTHLPAASVDRLWRNGRVQDLELDVADGLVAEGALAHAPLEALWHKNKQVKMPCSTDDQWYRHIEAQRAGEEREEVSTLAAVSIWLLSARRP